MALKRATAFVTGALIAMVVLSLLVGAASDPDLSNNVTVGTTFGLYAPSGPAVNLTEYGDYNLTDPFVDDNVSLVFEGGDMDIKASKRVNMSVEDLSGSPEVEVRNLYTNGTTVFFEPEQSVNFQVTNGSQVNVTMETPVKPTDGEADFSYSGPDGGATTITLEKAVKSNLQYSAVDVDSGEELAVATSNGDGDITFTDLPHSSHTVQITQSELTIREEEPPYDKLDGTVKIIFFENVDEDPVIVNRTVIDGRLDLAGLPITSTFEVQHFASEYHNRTILLEDLGRQNSSFLINKTTQTTIQNTFEINDRTGNFPEGSTKLIVQHPINRTLIGGNETGIQWLAVAGADLGADKRFTTDLVSEERYRLVVRNDAGDERVLGAYEAENPGTVQLEIGSIIVDPKNPEIVGYNATRSNSSGTVTVDFEYNDTSNNTNTLHVKIHEFGNESNELLTNTSFTNGPYGTFSLSQSVPSDEENVTWVVDFVADRSSGFENVKAEIVVGPQNPVLQDMPGWLISLLSLGAIWTVAGLFSELNGDIGGLVVAGVAGLLWYVNLLPKQTGSGVVALALITAGILFYNERRSPA